MIEKSRLFREKTKNLRKVKNDTFFPPVTEKPTDFERDICKAASEGKLSSVQYLVEQCHSDVETKNEYGFTPINNASYNGHLEVVKYLYEKCHAKITDGTINVARNDTIRKYLQSNK